MRVQFKAGHLIVVPDGDREAADLAAWRIEHDGHVFLLAPDGGAGACLTDLGPEADARREPINVHGASADPRVRLISNFAATPLVLDGIRYACVEAFWQSLRVPEPMRESVAALDGPAAKELARNYPYGTHVLYRGEPVAVGTFAHWQLMRRACRAKFEQNADARAALLATGQRPLIHRVRPESRTIPGTVMAEIWMGLRLRFREAGERQQRGLT